VPIAPDDKDWTWVLDRPCPECGLDIRALDVRQVPDMVRSNAAAWDAILGADDVRVRPSPEVWSPLEYGCHVRDVLRVYDVRLALMLTQDDPFFSNWDQDRTAIEERYTEQDPDRVRAELVTAAGVLADAFARVDASELARPGRRSDGATFTVETFARYFIHDPVHHLSDVRRTRPARDSTLS
jgi:DinB superfamily